MSPVPSAGPQRPTAAPPRPIGPRARTATLAGLALVGSFSLANAQVAPEPGPAAAVVAPGDALSRLRAAAPAARFSERLATGLRLALAGETPTARVQAFLATYPGLFGEGGPTALVPGVERGRSVRFEQTHAGVPVRGGGVTFAFDAEGRLKGYTDEVRRVTSVAPAKLDAAGAVAAARASLGVPVTRGEPAARAVLLVQAGVATPAFEVDLVVPAPLEVRRVLVEGVSGRVIGQETRVHR